MWSVSGLRGNNIIIVYVRTTASITKARIKK